MKKAQRYICLKTINIYLVVFVSDRVQVKAQEVVKTINYKKIQNGYVLKITSFTIIVMVMNVQTRDTE